MKIFFISFFLAACLNAAEIGHQSCSPPPGFSGYTDAEEYCSEGKRTDFDRKAMLMAIKQMMSEGKYKNGMAVCSSHKIADDGRIPLQFCDENGCDHVDVYLNTGVIHIFRREGIVVPDGHPPIPSRPLCFAKND